LTAADRILATLPIGPQFGKVLLDGCKTGISFEAAVAVAMSAMGIEQGVRLISKRPHSGIQYS